MQHRVEPESRDVALTIPAKPGYLVLARLALSAICRLTPLEAAEVADLKLAITEAAADFVDEEPEHAGDGAEDTLDFAFRLRDDCLVLELAGPARDGSAVEQELSRAIIEATVDEAAFTPGRTTLTKRLAA